MLFNTHWDFDEKTEISNFKFQKPCKYGQICTRIDYCEFLHHHKEKHIENIPESTNYKNEAEELGKKVTTLKAEIDLLKANVERQKEELKSIQNESNKKLDRFKNKQLEKENVDKDTLIKVLRGKLKDKEQIIEEQKDKVTRLMQDKLKNGKELNLLKEEAKLKKTESVKCKLISNKNGLYPTYPTGGNTGPEHHPSRRSYSYMSYQCITDQDKNIYSR